MLIKPIVMQATTKSLLNWFTTNGIKVSNLNVKIIGMEKSIQIAILNKQNVTASAYDKSIGTVSILVACRFAKEVCSKVLKLTKTGKHNQSVIVQFA
jgi:hypothetical protein